MRGGSAWVGSLQICFASTGFESVVGIDPVRGVGVTEPEAAQSKRWWSPGPNCRHGNQGADYLQKKFRSFALLESAFSNTDRNQN